MDLQNRRPAQGIFATADELLTSPEPTVGDNVTLKTLKQARVHARITQSERRDYVGEVTGFTPPGVDLEALKVGDNISFQHINIVSLSREKI